MDVSNDNLDVAEALGITVDELAGLVTGGTVTAIEVGIGPDVRHIGGWPVVREDGTIVTTLDAIREWLAALAPDTDEQKRLGNSVAQLLDTYDNTSGCKANLIRRMADAKRKYEEEE